jgi:hypothetical protein
LYLDSASIRHFDFLVQLASLHPALSFSDVKIEKRSEELFMIEAGITNAGKLPTMTAMAVNSRWVRKVRLEIDTSGSNKVIGGKRVFLFDRIVPGETVKAAWLVNGKGTVRLRSGSPQTDYIEKVIELK